MSWQETASGIAFRIVAHIRKWSHSTLTLHVVAVRGNDQKHQELRGQVIYRPVAIIATSHPHLVRRAHEIRRLAAKAGKDPATKQDTRGWAVTGFKKASSRGRMAARFNRFSRPAKPTKKGEINHVYTQRN